MHRRNTKLLDSNLRPNHPVIRHPLLVILRHSLSNFRCDFRVVRVDSEDLLPAFSTSRLQRLVHILKSQVNLLKLSLCKDEVAIFNKAAA